MSDLFKKLNTLVKAGLGDLLGDERARKPLSPARLGKDIDREVTLLRSRINEALDYELALQQRLQSLHDEVERLDLEADQAVDQGREELARHLIEQQMRAQQRRTMAENDLRQHQTVTAELTARVNMLEAAVADARRAQGEAAEESVGGAERRVADVLREAREKIAGMGDLISAREEAAAPPPPPAPDLERNVDDDLARRRARLSK